MLKYQTNYLVFVHFWAATEFVAALWRVKLSRETFRLGMRSLERASHPKVPPLILGWFSLMRRVPDDSVNFGDDYSDPER